MGRIFIHPNDIVGEKFGKLMVIKYNGKFTKNGYSRENHYYQCLCECGNENEVSRNSLINKKRGTKSCGCLFLENATKVNTKHGKATRKIKRDRIYGIYTNILARCYHENCTGYEKYGGRGITVCDEWLGESGLKNFYNWSLENGYSANLSIDRIDVNGDYEPSNCRWATTKEQNTNRQNTKLFKAFSPSGEIYYHYDQTLFSNMHNLNRSLVSLCINGKFKQHHKWKFAIVRRESNVFIFHSGSLNETTINHFSSKGIQYETINIKNNMDFTKRFKVDLNDIVVMFNREGKETMRSEFLNIDELHSLVENLNVKE